MSHIFDCISKNPLDVVTVGYSRRLNYTDIHIAALNSNNTGGIYDNLIADTKAKREALHDIIYASKINEASRKSSTTELKMITAEFHKTISRFEGLVKSVFGRKEPGYIVFFPFGIEDYRRANQEEIQIHLTNLIKFNLSYQTQLGTLSYHDKFTDINTRFITAISEQKQAASIITFNVKDKVNHWNDLKKQIYKNMLTIALLNIDTPQMLRVYDESHLLRFHRKKKGEVV